VNARDILGVMVQLSIPVTRAETLGSRINRLN
jgi:hypothetical protein